MAEYKKNLWRNYRDDGKEVTPAVKRKKGKQVTEEEKTMTKTTKNEKQKEIEEKYIHLGGEMMEKVSISDYLERKRKERWEIVENKRKYWEEVRSCIKYIEENENLFQEVLKR